jgi:hypothetical protein
VAIDSLAAIAAILQGTKAKPVAAASGGAPSSLYDLRYRLFVNACAFELHSKPSLLGARIQRARLKLVQFVAIRPWLTPVLVQWSESADDQQSSLEYSQRLRRAFLGDTIHDAVVDFLVAHQALMPSGDHLLAGPSHSLLRSWHSIAEEKDLFATERRALRALMDVKITIRMLEGR